MNQLLIAARKQKGWSQARLAAELQIALSTIKRWESGERLPYPIHREKLCILFNKSEAELGFDFDSSGGSEQRYWHIPFLRNPFFTGREEVLQQLHETLAQEGAATLSQIFTLSGLGGIGKTQTAIEYAYCYAHDYAAIFWINAETHESILASFVTIAELLNLPERYEKEPHRIQAAVLRWFTNHRDWLVIFDNVEDPGVVKEVVPSSRSGSLLFTSRRQSLGFESQTLQMEKMTSGEGVHFLLHRARLLEPSAHLDSLAPKDRRVAHEIVEAMDGLPLALDQAGAYIEATQCSLSDYWYLFQSSQLRLLAERDAYVDHPRSVVKTFTLVFDQVQRSNPAAAEVLSVCAFLAPEAIPETLFLEGAVHLGSTFETLASDLFAFQAVIKALLAYSLIQRDIATKTVTMHRLVQSVLKGSLSEEDQHLWVSRIVSAISQIFPSEVMQANYLRICQQLLPHALIYAAIEFKEVKTPLSYINLLTCAATYLSHQARYTAAMALYEQALLAAEQILGFDHPLVAQVLYGLAILYKRQGNFQEAKLVYERSLGIREKVHDPLVAESLNGLAEVYREQGKFQEAEPFYKRALLLAESTMRPEHPLIAEILNDMAILSWQQGKHKDAKLLYERALLIWQQELGAEHPQLAHSLYGLAILYAEDYEFQEAELLFQRALHIREQSLGFEHPQVTFPLHGLAELYKRQGKNREAELLFRRVLHIRKQVYGSEHPQLTYPLQGLAEICQEQGKYEEAEQLFQHALRIWEQKLGSEHPNMAVILQGLANLYLEQGKYKEAELLLRRALSLKEPLLGSDHLEVADVRKDLARFYRVQGKYEQALSQAERALQIGEQALGSQHPFIAEVLSELANLYQVQGKYEQAEPLYQRALRLWEQALGDGHLLLAEPLNGLAQIYHDQGKLHKALPFAERGLKLSEQALGEKHPKTKECRAFYTQLLQEKQGTID